MNALTIDKLCKTYASGVQALNDVSLQVAEGDFFALLGPNGAGKSTAIGIICNLVNKSSGKVQVFDADLDLDSNKARRYLGIVPQEFNFNIFEKVQNIVITQAGYYGISRTVAVERTEKYLKQLGLWEKRNSQAQHLSGGMKRRLMIARALIHEPKLLILDEPTAGVDIELRRSMWDFLIELNASGTTIILTTHYLEEAEQLCRNIAIINHGRVIQQGPMQEFLSLLQIETIVLYCTSQIDVAPKIKSFETRKLDDASFEVDIKKGQSLNSVMSALTTQGIEIHSMRNRSNRLEEMFMEMVNNKTN